MKRSDFEGFACFYQFAVLSDFYNTVKKSVLSYKLLEHVFYLSINITSLCTTIYNHNNINNSGSDINISRILLLLFNTHRMQVGDLF